MVSYSLGNFSLRDIRLSPQRYQAVAAYCWEHYSHFAHQRSLIFDQLKNALATNCQPYKFSQWQRAISYQFSLNPLSAKGSLLNDPGGRFNIGDIDQTKFPPFAALYLAEDRATAYKEKFGLQQTTKKLELTAEELMLTSGASVTIVPVGGELNQVLNLNDANTLKAFFNLIKNIKMPASFLTRAKKLNIPFMLPVKNIKELRKSLLQTNWRDLPMQVDIPANSQILGQVAYAVGIEAILYPSSITNKNCLAIFPRNFEHSPSYVEIEGKVPNESKHKRLDELTYLDHM